MVNKFVNRFNVLGARFLFFVSSKKVQKNTFFNVFPIVQPIYKTWRAVFRIVQPNFPSSYYKKHHIAHSTDQLHFQKSIVNFHFFLTFSVMFLVFFGRIPHMWQALFLKSYRYLMCKRIAILNKNHILCPFYVFFG